jgi:hypothetical protein
MSSHCPAWCDAGEHWEDSADVAMLAGRRCAHHGSRRLQWSDDRANAFAQIQQVDADDGPQLPVRIVVSADVVFDGVYDITLAEARRLADALRLLVRDAESAVVPAAR